MKKKLKINKTIIDEMKSILQKKLNYFRAFYDTSLKQKEAIKTFNNQEIEVLLIKKDTIISKIKEVDTRIRFLIKKNPTKESGLLDDNLIKSYNKKIKEIIDKIVPIENEVTEILMNKKNLSKEQLRGMQRRKIVITGYKEQKPAIPRFIDYKLK